jgi:hypothetical protein
MIEKPQPLEPVFECGGCCKRFPISMRDEHKCFGQYFWSVMLILLPLSLFVAMTCPLWVPLIEGFK